MAEIKHELTFGIDNFGKQNMLSKSESVAQVLINLLFMRPGQMPSLPHLGINIKQYLYKFEEDIDVTEDTIYRIASVSKIVVALAAMKLVEEGKMNMREDRHNEVQELVLSIAKNRQGMTSSIDLIFRGDCSAFTPTKKERK